MEAHKGALAAFLKERISNSRAPIRHEENKGGK